VKGTRFFLRAATVGVFISLILHAYSPFVGANEGDLYCPVPSETVMPVVQTVSSSGVPASDVLQTFRAETAQIKPSGHLSTSTTPTIIEILPSSPAAFNLDTPLPPIQVSDGIPMVMNDHVEDQLLLFQTRLKGRFGEWLSRSGIYLPMMQKILKEGNLPEDLVYLALIESGFHLKAQSPAKAVGPWQFIKGTAEQYGLRVNKWIDERRDPVKSTKAAAQYLEYLYGMFNSWTLSMASYNAGEGRIMRAMAATKAQDFWELRDSDHIRDETKAYVPKFMAATMIAKDPQKYGFFVDYQDPLHYEEVEIAVATPLKRIARAAGVSVQDILSFNPELKQETTPPGYPRYRLKLPFGAKKSFLEKFKLEKVVQKKFKTIAKKAKVLKKKKISIKKTRKYRISKVEKKSRPVS
jgi:membrane-bound lytic murein transglycosylase D